MQRITVPAVNRSFRARVSLIWLTRHRIHGETHRQGARCSRAESSRQRFASMKSPERQQYSRRSLSISEANSSSTEHPLRINITRNSSDLPYLIFPYRRQNRHFNCAPYNHHICMKAHSHSLSPFLPFTSRGFLQGFLSYFALFLSPFLYRRKPHKRASRNDPKSVNQPQEVKDWRTAMLATD